MESAPAVDVIVATNRCSPFLAEAVASVVGQTYENRNLIVVDDGCPDPEFVPAVLAGVARSEVIRRPSSGLSASRNAGIAHGSAPLLVFLDDDDTWTADKLEKQVGSLEQQDQCVASFTAGCYLNSDGSPTGGGWAARAVESAALLRGAEVLPRIVTLMVRRAVLEAVGGFDPELWLGEDIEFILRLAEHGEMACVAEATTYYRRHADNVSSVPPVQARRILESILTSRISAAAGRGDNETVELLREQLGRWYATWADESAHSVGAALKRADLAAARSELAWAASRAPLATARALLRRSRATILAPPV